MKTVTQYGEDYVTQVFNRYKRGPVTLREAAGGHAPTFRDVSNFFGEDATLMWLRFHIAETFAFVGIYDTASKMQVVQTAELILDHEVYGQLNLDEFLLFLKKFKRGDYGKIYQSARPNPQEFMLCLKPFWQELMEERAAAEERARVERQRREQEKRAHIPFISREEWEEIKEECRMIERMYEMEIPGRPPGDADGTAA